MMNRGRMKLTDNINPTCGSRFGGSRFFLFYYILKTPITFALHSIECNKTEKGEKLQCGECNKECNKECNTENPYIFYI